MICPRTLQECENTGCGWHPENCLLPAGEQTIQVNQPFFSIWGEPPKVSGWLCPRCHASNGPQVARCACSPGTDLNKKEDV